MIPVEQPYPAQAPHERAHRPARSDARANTLSSYFLEMSRNTRLSPEDEITLGAELEEAEHEVWSHLLCYPAAVDFVLDELGIHLELPEADVEQVRAAARTAKRTRRRPDQRALSQLSRALAPKLRALDPEHEHRDRLIRELCTMATDGLSKLAFAPSSKAFRAHLHELKVLEKRALDIRNRFVKANLGLVVTIARRSQRGDMPLADLIQEGNIGLVKAVDRFDHKQGFRFSTYAVWWIRHSVNRAIADKSRTVRLPVHLLDARQRIRKAEKALASSLGRQPTLAELAMETDMTEEKLTFALRHGSESTLSLDAPQLQGERDYLDVFRKPSEDGSALDDLILESMAARALSAVKGLSPIEQDVLERRFGLTDGDEETLQEIADLHGLSRERIRQIQQQGLDKVRKRLRKENAI